MSRSNGSLATVRQFQSETDDLLSQKEPLIARATLYTLVAFVLSFTVLAFVGRLDRVVTSVGGKIVPLDQINVIQSLDQAIIKSIDVREGQQVKPGQLLATLDATFTQADLSQTGAQIASLQAQVARAEAELAGTPLVFAETTDPDATRYNALQKALYDQRVAQYNAQLNSYDAKMRQLEATIAKLRNDDERYRQRAEIAKKIEDMRTTLAEHGTGSQLNMFLSQDSRLELVRTIENTHNALIESENSLASAKADKDAFKQQWWAALSQDLVQARNNLDTAKANYEKAAKKQDLVRLTAPEHSVVLTLAKLSIGSVLKPGDPFMTLMPLNARLEAEIKVNSRDVGFIRAGDPCTMKVDAFQAVEHGTANGRVRWISEGAFTADDDGRPVEAYYKARCSIDQMNFYDVPDNFRLIPGMTLTGDVNVGKRSVAMYLIGGMIRHFGEAMRER